MYGAFQRRLIVSGKPFFTPHHAIQVRQRPPTGESSCRAVKRPADNSARLNPPNAADNHDCVHHLKDVFCPSTTSPTIVASRACYTSTSPFPGDPRLKPSALTKKANTGMVLILLATQVRTRLRKPCPNFKPNSQSFLILFLHTRLTMESVCLVELVPINHHQIYKLPVATTAIPILFHARIASSPHILTSLHTGPMFGTFPKVFLFVTTLPCFEMILPQSILVIMDVLVPVHMRPMSSLLWSTPMGFTKPRSDSAPV